MSVDNCSLTDGEDGFLTDRTRRVHVELPIQCVVDHDQRRDARRAWSCYRAMCAKISASPARPVKRLIRGATLDRRGGGELPLDRWARTAT